MAVEQCCDAMELVWTYTRVADRWADVCGCRSCEHIHAMESWPVPLRFAPPDSCVNCGGHRESPVSPCDRCGFTEIKDRAFHDRLRAASPHASYLEAAVVAEASRRVVMSLKLSTASLRWESSGNEAGLLRLQCLETLGCLDEALEEASRWIRTGGPPSLYGTVAGLQAAMGDLATAAETLAYGVRQDPSSGSMWADLAEAMDILGDLPASLEAAEQAIKHPEVAERALELIRKTANHYYTYGQFEDAATVAKLAGDYQAAHADLSWIRAQAATFAADNDEALSWGRAVLQLQPDHTEAKELVERLAPRKKGWFSW